LAGKSAGVAETGGSGRSSDEGRDNITRLEPRTRGLRWWFISPRLVALIIPTETARGPPNDEGFTKPLTAWGYADLALKPMAWSGRVELIARHLSLKPYWGKPNVRNFREDAGNVSYGKS
jgi:hypothetical protein